MKQGDIVEQIIKADSYNSMQQSQIPLSRIHQIITTHLPQLTSRDTLQRLLQEPELFNKVKKIIELHQELSSRSEELLPQNSEVKQRQNGAQNIEAVSKKVTRAALARRHEKNQEQMRKDQIFVRLTPKSQGCIQFMLCNRNFPRMEVKLSCNQHLEYLVNYLTNKWIRGKVGVKVVLYPDSSFLKAISLSEKEKALKQPLNNYLMFTDIMSCCGVNQNGVLNMTYEIIQSKKSQSKEPLPAQIIKEPIQSKMNLDSLKLHSMSQPSKFKNGLDSDRLSPDKGMRQDDRSDSFQVRVNSPVKYSYKEEFLHDSLFNKNSNFFPNNDESMFGSLGFNFNFGATNKKDDPLFSLNSNHYFDSVFPDLKKSKEHIQSLKVQEENVSEREERSLDNGHVERQDSEDKKENSREKENGGKKKLDNLISIIDQVQKEKEGGTSQLGVAASKGEDSNNNSNRFKEVKTVNIVKRKVNNS